MKRLVCLSALIACVAFVACDVKNASKDKDDEAGDSKEVPPGDEKTGPGTLSIAPEEVESEVVTAGTNLAEVSEELVPPSLESGKLAVETELLLLDGSPKFCQDNPGNQMCQDCGPGGDLHDSQECKDFFSPGGEGYTEGENVAGGGGDGGNTGEDTAEGPCKGKTFFNCQPVLVKLYMALAKVAMKRSASFMKSMGVIVRKVDSQTGVLTPKGDRVETIEYRVTSKDDMEFLFKAADGKPFFHAAIKGNKYTFKNVKADGEEDGAAQVDVEYTDKTNWSLVYNVFNECDPADPQAPENITIKVTRTGQLWRGKAMMYSEQWPQGSCDDPFKAENGVSINTDFVGEPLFSTASLYMVPLSVDELDEGNVQTYAVQNLCTVFPSYCGGNTEATSALGDVLPSNPLCSKPDKTHEWGTACVESQVSEVAAAEYGPQTDWVAPTEMKAKSVVVPDSLAPSTP